MLEQIREAVPFVEQGAAALAQAGISLGTESFAEANGHQVEGIRALQEARERLLNLKGLIELAYADQNQTTSLLAPREDDPIPDEALAELVAARQNKNVERADRIRKMLDQQQQKLDSTPPAGSNPATARST